MSQLSERVDRRLDQSFAMFSDLAVGLSEEDLRRSLSEPSNSVWSQLWCVVGARESYSRAMEAGSWQGFSCSLTSEEKYQRGPVVDALGESASAVKAAAAQDVEGRFALSLLLHEVMHQGQLIRYLLGLELEVPESWSKRWSI